MAGWNSLPHCWHPPTTQATRPHVAHRLTLPCTQHRQTKGELSPLDRRIAMSTVALSCGDVAQVVEGDWLWLQRPHAPTSADAQSSPELALTRSEPAKLTGGNLNRRALL